MILHYSTEVSIHVSDNLEDVLSQIGMNANDIALAKSKVLRPAYPNDLYTPLPDRQTTFTCIPTDKIIGTTRSTPGQSVFDNVCFVPDSKRHSDKFNDILKNSPDTVLWIPRENLLLFRLIPSMLIIIRILMNIL